MAIADHIYINCGTYTHHGIDCGDGTAIHYTGERLRGIITRTTIAEFASGKQIFVKKYNTYEMPELVVTRAESRLGENKYDLIFNNCEHFASWCKTGKNESEQVNRVAATVGSAAGIGTSVAGFKAMNKVNPTFVVPQEITQELTNETLERVGGVIYEPQTKRVVAFIRETTPTTSPVSKLLQIGASASILNLAVTMMLFSVVNQRINEIEKRLQQLQEFLNKINRKIDLGYYASFRTGLEMAAAATKMKDSETRKGMAISAISKLKDADIIYTEYADQELEQSSKIADEYLQTLVLAYVAEARCYLELGAEELALDRLQIGVTKLRPRIQRYVEILLTSNPAAYLQPEFKDQIDLSRLTRIYQWIDSSLNENAVFNLHRQNFVDFIRDPHKWAWSVPSAILDRVEVPTGMFGHNPEDIKKEAIKRLPDALSKAESMIETYRRLEAYQTEIHAINKLGISFQDWLKLTPATEVKPEETELMYIIPNEPLELVIAS